MAGVFKLQACQELLLEVLCTLLILPPKLQCGHLFLKVYVGRSDVKPVILKMLTASSGTIPVTISLGTGSYAYVMIQNLQPSSPCDMPFVVPLGMLGPYIQPNPS